MAKFQTSLRLFQVALVVLLVVALWRARAVPAAIFAAGFAGSALEIVLLLGFQIALGSVYQKLGLLITAFMAGLAAGSAVGKRERFAASPRNVALLAVAIGAVSAALPVALRGLAGGGAALPVEIAFCALAFMLAAVVGLQFAVAGREPSCANAAGASRLYTADFLGASLGALGAGTLLIPLLGVANVCWLTAGVNVAAGVVVWASAGRGQPQ
jgi:predicted membrane-bound spermidine synthase